MITAGFVAPYLLDTTTRFVEAAAVTITTREIWPRNFGRTP